MNIDTGDASYGSLDKRFFENNKEYITTHCKLDSRPLKRLLSTSIQ